MQRFASFCGRATFIRPGNTQDAHSGGSQHGLSGIPYWGTDIAGFVPTKEFTAEFYLRWFQFPHSARYSAPTAAPETAIALAVDHRGPRPIEITNYNGAGGPTAEDLHNLPSNPSAESIWNCPLPPVCCPSPTS